VTGIEPALSAWEPQNHHAEALVARAARCRRVPPKDGIGRCEWPANGPAPDLVAGLVHRPRHRASGGNWLSMADATGRRDPRRRGAHLRICHRRGCSMLDLLRAPEAHSAVDWTLRVLPSLSLPGGGIMGVDEGLERRFTLLLFQNAGSISRTEVVGVRRDLEDLIKTDRDDVEIDVWLESPGGDAHAAFKLASLLRQFAARIRVVVPDYAKSAATLLTLCADEIYMGPGAELGPLDAQIPNEGAAITAISALDIARSIDELVQTALTIAVAGGAQVLRTTGLGRAETLSSMLTFSAQLLEPIVRQLDPKIMHWSSSLLKVAPEYAERLLAETERGPTSARSVAHRLVEEYPTHGFVITEREAFGLGLPVQPIEEYDHADLVRQIHRGFEDGSSDLVKVLPMEHLVDLEERDEAPAANGATNERDGDGTGSGDASAVEHGE
jgi:Serine dehydrogenase proteinase